MGSAALAALTVGALAWGGCGGQEQPIAREDVPRDTGVVQLEELRLELEPPRTVRKVWRIVVTGTEEAPLDVRAWVDIQDQRVGAGSGTLTLALFALDDEPGGAHVDFEVVDGQIDDSAPVELLPFAGLDACPCERPLALVASSEDDLRIDAWLTLGVAGDTFASAYDVAVAAVEE